MNTMTRDRTRRRFLRFGGVTLAGAVTIGLAGCSGDGGSADGNGNGNGNGNDTGDMGGLDVVPAGASSVAYADVAGMIADGTVEEFLNEVFSTAGEGADSEGPTSEKEFLDGFEDETGLNPRDIKEMVGFGRTPESVTTATPPAGQLEQTVMEYSGTRITTGWSETDLVSAIEGAGEKITVESDTYNGYTVYQPSTSEDDTGTATAEDSIEDPDPEDGTENSDSMRATVVPDVEMESPDVRLGVVADGEYVFGTSAAVEDALDVAAGDEDSLAGDILNTYDGVRDGLLKMASSTPEELPAESIPDEPIGESGVEIDPTRLEGIQDIALVVYTDGDEMGMAVSMNADTEEAAGHVVEILDGAIATLKQNVESEDLAAELDAVSVEQDGGSVGVGYANDIATITDMINMIGQEFPAMTPGEGDNSDVVTGDETETDDEDDSGGSVGYGLRLPV